MSLFSLTRTIRCQFLVAAPIFLLLCALPAWSQEGAAKNASAREIIESEQRAEKIIEEKGQAEAVGVAEGATPLGAMLGLRAALDAGDETRAAEFLDMRYLPDDMDEYTPEALLQALGYVWGQQNIFDLSALSDDRMGHRDDGLPSYRDQIGVVTLSTGEVPIFLQRVPDGEGGKVWKLSNETVAQIPAMWDELGYSPVAIFLRKYLPEFSFLGMENWQLVGSIGFFVIAWPLAATVSGMLMRVALRIPNRFPLGIQRFFKGPMRLFLFLQIARYLINELGLSLKARILLQSSGLDYIAYTILIMGLLTLWRDYQIRKMQHAGNAQYVALLKPLTTIIKFVVVLVIGLVWANSAGYDMSTVLAGLGVGSVAVALAAQKTLENVIGAITLYLARPVSAGDFCRFGTVTGTVEEIGLRSTLIRTLDRTMVVIPNSVFSSSEIENYSRRDRIRYYRNFRLQLVGAEQLRFILAEVRKVFLAHPEVMQETVSVRFDRIEAANAMLRLDAGVKTTDFQQFLAVAEDLNLRIVTIVDEAGAVFSGPGQFVQMTGLPPASEDQVERIEQVLEEWREEDRLPFPNYADAEIAAFKGSLDYPPGGSSTQAGPVTGRGNA